LRIAILAHNVRFAGARHVAVNVIWALARVGTEHEYQMILPRGYGYEELPKPPHSECHYVRRVAGLPGTLLFERFGLPRKVNAFRPDVVWGLGNSGLPKPPCPQAILFQKPQLIYEAKYRQGLPLKNRAINWGVRRRLVGCLPATQLVFCNTPVAAERFPRFLPYSGRITLLVNALSEFSRLGDPAQRPPVFARLAGKRVLFCLTRYYPHKNLERLLEAFHRYRAQLQEVAIIFTISPGQNSQGATFLRRIQRLGLQDNLVSVGQVDQAELPGYYRNCEALILPTLLESFSATYVEAMHYDCPILTSDIDFARGICGEAALYFDPFSVEAIRDAVLKFLHAPALRQRLVAAGAQRRKLFARNWDSITTECLQELASIAGFAPAPEPRRGKIDWPQPVEA
jgi:glycosyltransferase involved in cell wall biosynthesis